MVGADFLSCAEVTFIEDHLGNETGVKVCCYLIGERLVQEKSVERKARSYRNDGNVYVKTYNELLANAEMYHNEFIDKYEKLKRK